MNTVMSIVRTILPLTRPASTAVGATRHGAATESAGLRGTSAGATGTPTGIRGTGLPQREPYVDDHEADLTALLPRQTGPDRAPESLAGDADEECRERRAAAGGSREPGSDRVASDTARTDAASARPAGAAGDDSDGASSCTRADTECDADGGMSTAEYAIGTVAAAALAAVLYMIVTGDSVTSALTSIIEQALSVDF